MKEKKEEIQVVAYLSDDGFCKLLNHLIEQQDISAQKLSEGLCTESMFSKIRKGEILPDKLMRDRLLARLGLSDERCENLLDHEGYVEWTGRRDIIKAVRRKEITKARELLEKYAGSKAFSEKIEQQFYRAMEIQLMLYESVPDEEISNKEIFEHKLAMRLEQAVKLTVPSIDNNKICDLQLDLQELNLILEYEKYSHPERFTERCEEILQYIENSAMDERSRAKIFPKAVWYLCKELQKAGFETAPQILKLINHALEILRNTQKNHYLWEILSMREMVLENLMEGHKARGNEKCAEALRPMYQENTDWKDAIHTIYEMVSHPLQTDNFCYFYMQQEMHDIKDVMRNRREMLGISREKLNAGAFDKKTLIRLEAGHGKPRLSTIKTLFARLNLSGELQRVDVVTDSKEARDLVEQLVKQANNFELEKEQETLEQLGQHLDMRIPLNRQFVKAQQAIILHGGRKCNREKAFEVMKEALEFTIPLEKIRKSEKRYLTGGEITCLYNMAIYAGNSELNEYHEMLLKLCEEYESKESVETHIGKYAWIMTLIAKIYSNMRLYEQAMEVSKKLIRFGLECGRLTLVQQNIDYISWNRMQLQEKGTSGDKRCDRRKDLEMCVVMSRFCKEQYWEKKYAKKLQMLGTED